MSILDNEISADALPFRSWPLRIARVLYDNGITTWPVLERLTWNQVYSTKKLREKDIFWLQEQMTRRGGAGFRPDPEVQRKPQPTIPKWKDRVSSDAGVYFLQCDQFVKIGVTSSFIRRMDGYNLHCPLPMRYLAKFRYLPSVAYKKEHELHVQFKALHHRGEWFRLEQPILDYLELFRIGVSEVRL